ncbi:MAG: 16S rRNA (cytosine(1402)-N(4))-methyltransferase RsmH [Parcubacteria group bacterium]|nr:16S rRNA (cytosine(1402)-N(4))-methyltransferase RsmH [Parcubacteria group bacterium]
MHIPVLLKETLEILDLQSNENYIDATLGEGGHTKEIIKKIGPKGKVLGIDWDKQSLEYFQKDIIFEGKERVVTVCGNYADLQKCKEEGNVLDVKGVLFDLGWSSAQLGVVRGLSFKESEEELDMRFTGEGESAKDVVNTYREEEIANIIYEFGDERYSRRIAKAIIETRRKKKIETVGDLVEILTRVLPRRYEGGRIHPATRTFQALRIHVNHELENIEKGLKAAVEILDEGGRIVVISFHSLEDRLVKNFFREEVKKKTMAILTKKPVCATRGEVINNPRARSAKLRAAQVILSTTS